MSDAPNSAANSWKVERAVFIRRYEDAQQRLRRSIGLQRHYMAKYHDAERRWQAHLKLNATRMEQLK